MRRRKWFWVLAAVGILFGAKYFLLDVAASPSAQYVIDLTALHRLATSGGELPEKIEVEQVGSFAFPRSLVVAGEGFRLHPMALLVHRVAWTDRSVLIDTAMSPAATDQMPGSEADPAAFARVLRAMDVAESIVFTHEHPDHVGGLSAAADAAPALEHARMTREQLSSPNLERKEFPAQRLEGLKALDYSGLYLVAPGVVVQKAPGHSVGSQIVYVELKNGASYLFVGDIAWSKENITLRRGRPALAGMLLHEDRAAVAAQLEALAALPSAVHVIVAHDPAALEEDVAAGLLTRGFHFEQPAPGTP